MNQIYRALISLIFCLAGNAAAQTDIPRLIDTDGPAQGVQELALHELWRVGGPDEDLIFGRIIDLERHPDGCIYILDNQLCQVVVISPDGEHLRDLSREGDGPGELRQPIGLGFPADDLLCIGTGFPGKLITLRLDGTPLDTHYPVGEPAEGNVAIMTSLNCVDGVLAVTGGRIAFLPGGESHTNRFMSVGDHSLTDYRRILEVATPFDPTGRVFVEADNYYIEPNWALGPGGRIYAPMQRDVYEITEFDTKGQAVRSFGRRYEPRKRSRQEQDAISPLINTGTPPTADWKIMDHDPCIARIMVDPDNGQIWVLTPDGHEDQPDGVLETWDIFAPDGAFLRQVTVPLGGEINEGTCFLLGDRHLAVVRGTGSVFSAGTAQVETGDEGEIEPLEVICYEMP